MANNPTVKVSFIGDSGDLSKSIGNVDKQLGAVSADLSKHSSKMSGAFKRMGKDAEHGFKGVRDSADDTERRIIGFRDSLTGTADIAKGIREGDLVALATGFADVASAVANLGADLLAWGKKALEGAKGVVQAHAASVVAKTHDIATMVAHKVATLASTIATQAQAAAQWALNAAMSANPIVLVVAAIAALTAGVILAYKNSETFRDIVDSIGRFFRDKFIPAVGDVVEAVGKIASKVKDVATDLWGFAVEVMRIFGNIRETIENAFKNAVSFIKSIFTGVFNFIAEGIESVVNGFVSAFNGSLIRGINILNPFKDVPKLDKISLPRFDRGGIMPGRIGEPGLAVLHGGETVLPTHRGGASNTYNITVQSLDPRTAERLVIDAIQGYENSHGYVPIRRIMHRNAS